MKKLTITVIIMLILICITTGGVQAVFQSIPNSTALSYTTDNWLVKVRQMEATGQVMGLRESLQSTTVGTSNLLPSSSSNGIDVHLQKNTEYGAMLILAVSDYGKQGNGTDGSDHINDSTYGLATTTGNKTGVYEVGAVYEAVAAGNPYDNASVSQGLYKANVKYRDEYIQTVGNQTTYTPVASSLRAGDALNMYNWQGVTGGTWFYRPPNLSYATFYMQRKGLAFNTVKGSGTATGRAVMVNGTGF